MQTITKKSIFKFPIRNETNVNIVGSYYIEKEVQNYFKNGKKKGKAENDYDYYFFDNKESEESFLSRNQDLKKYSSFVHLVVAEFSRYNTDFVNKNLNKND